MAEEKQAIKGVNSSSYPNSSIGVGYGRSFVEYVPEAVMWAWHYGMGVALWYGRGTMVWA